MSKCANCGGECPSGTLPNGLCNQCDLVGKTIFVEWGRFGTVKATVTRVTQNTIYAARFNARRQALTSARPVRAVRGGWELK